MSGGERWMKVPWLGNPVILLLMISANLMAWCPQWSKQTKERGSGETA
jgi:hypothetical protein